MRTMDEPQNAVCPSAVRGNSTTEPLVPEPMLAPQSWCKQGTQNGPFFRIVETAEALAEIHPHWGGRVLFGRNLSHREPDT